MQCKVQLCAKEKKKRNEKERKISAFQVKVCERSSSGRSRELETLLNQGTKHRGRRRRQNVRKVSRARWSGVSPAAATTLCDTCAWRHEAGHASTVCSRSRVPSRARRCIPSPLCFLADFIAGRWFSFLVASHNYARLLLSNALYIRMRIRTCRFYRVSRLCSELMLPPFFLPSLPPSTSFDARVLRLHFSIEFRVYSIFFWLSMSRLHFVMISRPLRSPILAT